MVSKSPSRHLPQPPITKIHIKNHSKKSQVNKIIPSHSKSRVSPNFYQKQPPKKSESHRKTKEINSQPNFLTKKNQRKHKETIRKTYGSQIRKPYIHQSNTPKIGAEILDYGFAIKFLLQNWIFLVRIGDPPREAPKQKGNICTPKQHTKVCMATTSIERKNRLYYHQNLHFVNTKLIF